MFYSWEWEIVKWIVLPLVFGSYAFTFALYKKMTKQLEDILTNHLVHVHNDYKKILERIDKLESR